jgi:putative spermidine/putrescine transport system permease protein
VAARDRIFGWVYVSPLLLVLVPFFVAPLLVVIAASFFESDGFGGLIANPTLGNYVDIFTSALTFNLYLETIKFTVLTWFFSLIIGFWIAYFLVFHVRSPLLLRAPCRAEGQPSAASENLRLVQVRASLAPARTGREP